MYLKKQVRAIINTVLKYRGLDPVTNEELLGYDQSFMEDGESYPLQESLHAGDAAMFSLPGAIQGLTCTILKVHYTESKVSYDIEVLINQPGEWSYNTRLYNVDSNFVLRQ